MTKLRNLSRFCLLLLAGALLPSCGNDAITAPQGAKEKILLFNNAADPRFLDPQLINSVSEHHLLMSLYEGLVAERPDTDVEVEPGMADRWEANADKTVWTFHLRDNAKWSDGVAITAEDFVWSWRRMLTKKMAAEYSQMLFALKNGEAFYEGKVPAEEVGVKALDPRTLQVSLVGPTPHFLLVLCHTSWWPVPRHTMEKFGDPFDRLSTKWMDDGNHVGNGPFKLKRNAFRRMVDVERNPHYWDAANVKLNGIRFYPVESDTTEERLFRQQLLHVTQVIPLDKLPGYRKDHKDVVHTVSNLASYFYRINTTRGPLKDPKVRLALGLAIDRQSLVDNVTRGGQTPGTGIVPPMDGYEGAKIFHLDVAEARRLMAEAGFPDGKGFPKNLNILINKSESHAQIAQAIQQMWRQNLGVEIGIQQQEFSVYLNSTRRLDFDIARAGWNADYYDAATFLGMWKSDDGNNQTGWKNPAYDQLMRDSTQEGDLAKRAAILHQAEEMMLKEAPVLPIYNYAKNYLVHPSVKGWGPKKLDNHPWKYIDLVSPAPASTMDRFWNK
ncbi:MAG: peptide ABC transporter substrate-binding protein [Verrucomicrobiota bacterium]